MLKAYENSFRFDCDFSVGDAIIQALIWFLLIIVTLGLASFLLPYYVPKAVIERTRVMDMDGEIIGTLAVDFSLGAAILNALLWLLLSIVTFGLAYIVYVYRVLRFVLMETRVQFHEA